MRLFIAIDFPLELKKEIVASIQSLTSAFPQVAWIKAENLHLTLKFLGQVDEIMKGSDLVAEIKDGIKQSCCKISPFMLSFTDIGCFLREQLIIFLRIQAEVTLSSLVKQVETRMAEIGFPKENRRYSPHITLGRGKHISSSLVLQIKDAINERQPTAAQPFLVEKLTLMQSTLTKSGPIYTSSGDFSLLAK